MKIEIDGCTSHDQVQKMMDALAQTLLYDSVAAANIETDEPSSQADVHLVCFDVRRHTCPFSVIEWLEQLEGKRILLVAFSALGKIDGYRRRIESQIVPFLPEACTYEGMYLCPARMTREEYEDLENQMTLNGKQENIPRLKEMYNESLIHPDEEDIKATVLFIAEKLGGM